MNILQQLVADIQKDLILKKQIVSIRALETGPFFERKVTATSSDGDEEEINCKSQNTTQIDNVNPK